MFLALPPEAGPEAGPEGGAGGDDGDPVAAEAVMFSVFSSLSFFVAWNVAVYSFKPAYIRVEAAAAVNVTGGWRRQCQNNVLSTSHHKV